MGNSKQFAEQSPAAPLVSSRLPLYPAQVILGSPKNKCDGLGICRMYMTTKRIPVACSVIATWLGRQENGRLRIGFIKASLSKYDLKKHFGGYFFQVPQAFSLPEWAQRKLQLTRTEIDAGAYPVWEAAEALIVDF